MGGALYFIPAEKKAAWVAEVEALGFTVEDCLGRMSEAETQKFAFVGKLKNGTTERFIHLETLDSGYMLAVRFAGKDDPAFLKQALGSRLGAFRKG